MVTGNVTELCLKVSKRVLYGHWNVPAIQHISVTEMSLKSAFQLKLKCGFYYPVSAFEDETAKVATYLCVYNNLQKYW